MTKLSTNPQTANAETDELLSDFIEDILSSGQWRNLDGSGCQAVSSSGNRFETIALWTDYTAEDYFDIEEVVTRFPDGRLFLWKVRVGKTPAQDTCELVEDFEPIEVEPEIRAYLETTYLPSTGLKTTPLF